MTTQTATIQLRIDGKTKADAQVVLKKLGLDISSAIKVFLRQVVKTKSLPLKTLTVNGFTPEYEASLIKELKAMKAGRAETFDNVEDFMKSLRN